MGVQCVTGHPLSAGGSHATATICTTCSAANFTGAPGRGSSANTWHHESFQLLRRHRCRFRACQSRRRLRPPLPPADYRPPLVPQFLAIWALGDPVAASRTMRMRAANACGVLSLRSKRSKISCCVSLNVITTAFGPGMAHPFHSEIRPILPYVSLFALRCTRSKSPTVPSTGNLKDCARRRAAKSSK